MHIYRYLYILYKILFIHPVFSRSEKNLTSRKHWMHKNEFYTIYFVNIQITTFFNLYTLLIFTATNKTTPAGKSKVGSLDNAKHTPGGGNVSQFFYILKKFIWLNILAVFDILIVIDILIDILIIIGLLIVIFNYFFLSLPGLDYFIFRIFIFYFLYLHDHCLYNSMASWKKWKKILIWIYNKTRNI